MNINAFLVCSLAAACGQAATPSTPVESNPVATAESSETDPSETEPSETWIAGTPFIVSGEGLSSMYYRADSAEGPWPESSLVQLDLGDADLAPGHVHRLQVHSRAGVADESSRVLVMDAQLESRPGGPPVLIHPGVGAAGLTLQDAADVSEDMEFGPIRLQHAEATIYVDLAAVGSVRVGDHIITGGQSLEEVAAQLGECRHQANRGATLEICAGLTVIQGYGTEDLVLMVTPL